MPEGKLTITEHWELSAKEIAVQKGQITQQALLNEEQALQLRFGSIQQQKEEVKRQLANDILERDKAIGKAGKRLKAQGNREKWSISLNQEAPAESMLIWADGDGKAPG